MILRANCKINLGLDILRRRADGYHDLETVMLPVRGLYDEVEVVRMAGAGVDFRAEGLAVDCEPEQNICIKAFRLMHDRYGVDGVSIRLDKRVPFGAGLGGGSSDGTAVLLALDRLFNLHLSEAELIARAAELGSDTPFFVRNTPQFCTGRGEIMSPFPLSLGGLTLVIVKPDEGVSTREAYAGVRPRVPSVPLAERLRRPVAEWQEIVTNDFEPHIFAAHPAIRASKRNLLDAGALYASMSGSGSAVFGLFDRPEKAESLRSQTPCPVLGGCDYGVCRFDVRLAVPASHLFCPHSFLVAGVSRSAIFQPQRRRVRPSSRYGAGGVRLRTAPRSRRRASPRPRRW